MEYKTSDKTKGKKAYAGRNKKKFSRCSGNTGYDKRSQESGFKESETNDVTWYSRFPQLINDSATFPFSYPVGSPFSLSNSNVTNVDYNNIIIPGVYQIAWLPSIGIARDGTAPINVAARNIYTFLRNENSGKTNYEAPDLMMYLLAMDSLLSFQSMLKRVYGVARLFSPTNRYYPRQLLIAMNVDPDDIFAHLADLRYYVNLLADKIGQLVVPNDYYLFTRHRWMNEGLYVDGVSDKAQTYMFTQAAYLQYTNTGSTGTELKWVPYAAFDSVPKDKLYTLDELIAYFNKLFNPVMLDEDFNIMSGDILKAYGPNVYKIPYVTEDYMVLPTYDETVLMQIHNMTITGPVIISGIYQNPSVNNGTLQFQVYTKSPGDTWDSVTSNSRSVLLNMYKDNVTPGDVMEATRLIVRVDDTPIADGDVTKYAVLSCGTEIVACCYIHFPEWAEEGKYGVVPIQTNNPKLGVTPTADQTFTVAGTFALSSQFDWAPQLWVDTKLPGTGVTSFTATPAFDVANYTVLTPDNVNRLHEVALLSLFQAPARGVTRG